MEVAVFALNMCATCATGAPTRGSGCPDTRAARTHALALKPPRCPTAWQRVRGSQAVVYATTLCHLPAIWCPSPIDSTPEMPSGADGPYRWPICGCPRCLGCPTWYTHEKLAIQIRLPTFSSPGRGPGAQAVGSELQGVSGILRYRAGGDEERAWEVRGATGGPR